MPRLRKTNKIISFIILFIYNRLIHINGDSVKGTVNIESIGDIG